MLNNEKKLLKSIGKDEFFKNVINKLLANIILSDSEKSYILACAILFLKYYSKDRRHTDFADFSYYIILKYSLTYKDYTPLYDFAVNFGFYPVAKALLSNGLINNYRISNYLVEVGLNRFKNENDYTETLEQHVETKRFFEDHSSEKSYLAPTSFGKSSLIVDYIKKNFAENLKIAIIVPTKSLLSQTHKMIRRANFKSKIIIHEEMYDNAPSFIAVFTQERALRLLNRNVHTYYDVLFIDEAHNMLKNDNRSILLSRLIAKNRYRNPNQKIIYLSPLIEDANNLKIKEAQSISTHSIHFNVKEPEIFEYKLNNKIVKYNRFIDQFYEIGLEIDKFTYLKRNFKNKNFLYNYRPVNIESLAIKLCHILPKLEMTQNILDLEMTLKKEVHKDFYAIECLKFGVIYLHGKLPDIIKEYLESKFKILDELKYVIANSVILEGMNLPIDSLFIFNTRSLYGKELMNLIGRVNRLNNIFSAETNNLEKLLPEVHFINNVEYNGKGNKMENKIRLLRNKIFEDVVKNPVLNSFDFENITVSKDKKEAAREKIQKIQNNEKYLYSSGNSDEDIFKRYLIETGISDFYNNIEPITLRLVAVANSIKTKRFPEWQSMRMMDKIEYLFIRSINVISDFEFERFKYLETRNYYENYILISQKQSLNENINSQYKYFKEKAASAEKRLYVGKTYGEESYMSGVYPGSKNKVYVDLSKKSNEALINLAIAKLKIEADFVSFKLSKFIEMMYDFQLISKDHYNIYIYGTTDEKKIELTKFGLSINLISRLEKDGQLNNLSFDKFNNLEGNSDFQEFKNNIDDFYRFEIDRYLSQL